MGGVSLAPPQDLSELVREITDLNNGQRALVTLGEIARLLVSYGFVEPKSYGANLDKLSVRHVSFNNGLPVVILGSGAELKFGASGSPRPIDTTYKPDPAKMAAALDAADALFAEETAQLDGLLK